jgi:hypothetical protein
MGLRANLVVVQQSGKSGNSAPRQEQVVVKVEDLKEASVVVDGKAKKIGKKSAYLLDMLSLDD